MGIQKELESLVKVYSEFNEIDKTYSPLRDKNKYTLLEKDFVRLLDSQLLKDGVETEKVKKNYHFLSLYFHTDHKEKFLNEVRWLEHTFFEATNESSEDSLNKGICFKILGSRFDRLVNPNKYKKNIDTNNINTIEDWKKYLEHMKNNSIGLSSKFLWDSLIHLLDQSIQFYDETGTINQKGLRILIRTIPLIFISYGAFIFAEELFAIYGIYFFLLKGSQRLERSDDLAFKFLGEALEKGTRISATLTTAILARILELTFWLSRQCLEKSMQLGSTILKPLLARTSNNSQSESLCTDLILANESLRTGLEFKTPELKLIAAPIETYLGMNREQFFRQHRLGQEKANQAESFLNSLKELDDSTQPLNTKLAKAKYSLNELILNKPQVNTSKTAIAAQQSEQILTLLEEDSFQMN